MSKKVEQDLAGLVAPVTPVYEASKTCFGSILVFSVRRVSGGWSFIHAMLSPDLKTVTNVIESQPDMKAIAIEQFKIHVGKYWAAQEG